MMTREDRFTDLILRVGFLTREEYEQVRQAHRAMAEQGFDRPLVDFMVERQSITPAQVMMLNLTIRHDEARAEDKALAEYLRKRSLVPKEAIEQCFDAYEEAYTVGLPFPRLHKLLAKRGYLGSDHARRIIAERSQPTVTDHMSQFLNREQKL